MFIKGAKIYTCDKKGIIENGFIKIENGKIVDIGNVSDFPEAYFQVDILDMSGKYIFPGMIDVHTHLGIIGDSLGFEGDDLNEMTDPSTPHLRAVDAVNPMDICFSDAYCAGVTSVVTGPGSSNPISGQMIAMKTYGKHIDKMILREPVSIKFSLGENPKGVYHGKSLSPETRMATAAIIRETLKKAVKYKDDIDMSENDEEVDKPDFDFKCEALLALLRGEVPAHFHAHRADDIFTALRIAKEFSLEISIVHCTEGHIVADELALASCNQENFFAFIGPILCDRSKPELKNLSVANAKVLNDKGIKICIMTDHSVVPIQYLRLSAMLAVKEGLSMEDALNAITINPAVAIGLGNRIGSLAVGKDADIVICSGEPLDFYTEIERVFIDGKEVFSSLAKEG